jgi:hypothetical protein
MIDLDAAGRFIDEHGRLIDRRRFAVLFRGAPAGLVATALNGYRNPDGGIGALEPDLRTPSSQPIPVLYAFDILHEAGVRDDDLTAGALDWLDTISGDDGGIPFVLPSAREAARSPWLAPQDDPPPTLHMTTAVAGAAHRLGLEHPWLDRATRFCWDHLGELDLGAAYEVRYTIDFLDAVPDRARADAELDRLADHIPPSGLPVKGGAEGEVLSPLDVAPWPGHAGRRLFDDATVERHLDELEAAQHDDGGWTFDWPPLNDAVLWEWRGAVTIQRLKALAAYGRISPPPDPAPRALRR